MFLVSLGDSYSILGDNPIELDKTAQVGDFIGGLVGSLWSFAGIILFFLALLLQMKEFKSQREELSNQRKEFKLNRITNIIYKQNEIANLKLDRVNLKVKSQSINSFGLNAIRDFHFKARMWLGGKTEGKLLTEKEKDNLIEFYVFPMTGEFQDFILTVQSSLNLLVNLISEGFDSEEIEKSEVNQFYQIIGSNFYLDELIHFLTEEEIIFRMYHEYFEAKTSENWKLTGGDKLLQERRQSILRMIGQIKSQK